MNGLYVYFFLTRPSIGSMTDVPEDLLEQIKELERLFIVKKDKLKDITDSFIQELTKGDYLTILF